MNVYQDLLTCCDYVYRQGSELDTVDIPKTYITYTLFDTYARFFNNKPHAVKHAVSIRIWSKTMSDLYDTLSKVNAMLIENRYSVSTVGEDEQSAISGYVCKSLEASITEPITEKGN